MKVTLVSFALGVSAVLAAQKVNPEARILANFTARVRSYLELHKREEKPLPALPKDSAPAAILAHQQALARRLSAARSGAGQGDILTGEVATLFRRLLAPRFSGPGGRDLKQALREDQPPHIFLRINASYPEDAPLPTVPPGLLQDLPKLPEELEYRFIHRDLILRDVHANMIVDYFTNAIPAI